VVKPLNQRFKVWSVKITGNEFWNFWNWMMQEDRRYDCCERKLILRQIRGSGGCNSFRGETGCDRFRLLDLGCTTSHGYSRVRIRKSHLLTAVSISTLNLF
jgi:hypothetical protein